MFLQQTKRFLISAMIITAAAVASADNINNLPTTNVGGTLYHYHTVQQHETVYALSKRFGVSEAHILKLNPKVSDGLKTGQMLLIATAGTVGPKQETYIVKKHETAYGISKRFGLTLDEFYKLNPDARDEVREGQTVIIKSSSTGINTNNPAKKAETQSGSDKKHIIAEHETLYQIARDNNISLSELLAANPGLDAAHYSAGTSIVVPPASTTHQNATTALQSVTTTPSDSYQVKAGDTFYGIATRHGIDLAQLYASNPGIDVLKEGMMITLPSSCAENLHPATVIAEPRKITVAVALPFQLQNKGKHNKNMVEFYRGFLLAVDSLRSMGQPIHLLTYDTEGTEEGLAGILATPELKKAQVIIGPDDPSHLSALNKFGNENRIMVLNVFNNRDSDYISNPYAAQAALPREQMYSRASAAFINNFDAYIPVFLVNNDGKKDKMEFVELMKADLNKSGRAYKEIIYNGTLSLEILKNSLDPYTKYAFMPASSHKDEFERVATALQSYKDTRDFKNETVVWGYPEWLANRANYSKMHDLDSYIYSRNDLPENSTTAPVDANYNKWYGGPMMQSFPRRAYMGFDTGIYILKALAHNGGDFTLGTPVVSSLTYPFSLKRHEGGGMYNNDLLLINLAPGEIISKRSI